MKNIYEKFGLGGELKGGGYVRGYFHGEENFNEGGAGFSSII